MKDIINLPFPDTEYYKSTYDKTQIVLHHTVSNGSAQAVADYWRSLKNRIGTAYIIDKSGTIYSLFKDIFYAGHIGSTTKEMDKFSLPYRSCSKNSIGIELINMGGLKKIHGKYSDAYGHRFTDSVIDLSYRNYDHFASYTQAQIDSLSSLLKYLSDKHNIPLTYDESTFWDLNENALSGIPGLYPHTAYRWCKSDIFPQEEMKEMLDKL